MVSHTHARHAISRILLRQTPYCSCTMRSSDFPISRFPRARKSVQNRPIVILSKAISRRQDAWKTDFRSRKFPPRFPRFPTPISAQSHPARHSPRTSVQGTPTHQAVRLSPSVTRAIPRHTHPAHHDRRKARVLPRPPARTAHSRICPPEAHRAVQPDLGLEYRSFCH